MGQTFTDDCYALTHSGNTDLTNMETNFATLKSMFSGGSAPSNNVAGMPWFDTTNKVLKIRNQANSSWLGVMYGNSNNKIWMYSNTATDGWTVYSSLTDRVLAIKGGSQAYNVSGGNVAGTWTQPNHTLTASEIPDHSHNVNSGGAHAHDLVSDNAGSTVQICVQTAPGTASGDNSGFVVSGGAHTHTTATDGGGDTAHSHGTTFRPAAAVGTLQYPSA